MHLADNNAFLCTRWEPLLFVLSNSSLLDEKPKLHFSNFSIPWKLLCNLTGWGHWLTPCLVIYTFAHTLVWQIKIGGVTHFKINPDGPQRKYTSAPVEQSKITTKTPSERPSQSSNSMLPITSLRIGALFRSLRSLWRQLISTLYYTLILCNEHRVYRVLQRPTEIDTADRVSHVCGWRRNRHALL